MRKTTANSRREQKGAEGSRREQKGAERSKIVLIIIIIIIIIRRTSLPGAGRVRPSASKPLSFLVVSFLAC